MKKQEIEGRVLGGSKVTVDQGSRGSLVKRISWVYVRPRYLKEGPFLPLFLLEPGKILGQVGGAKMTSHTLSPPVTRLFCYVGGNLGKTAREVSERP